MAYFDNNSTTRPIAEVLDAMYLASEQNWANPSSPHLAGTRVRALIEKAREEIAEYLTVSPSQLTFTSGATESNNAILSSVANRHPINSGNILISAIEHPSISETAQFYFGENIHTLPVNSDGIVEIAEFEKQLEQKQPDLVALIAVHNETGVIQPWQEVAQICKDQEVWFHCDATQWVGKLDHAGLNKCTSFSFSAHKFGGPRGVGGLVSSKPISFIKGGGQQMETRGGTENFPGIEGMRIAWGLMSSRISSLSTREVWRDRFEDYLSNQFSDLKIIGKGVPRLWNTTLLCLPEFDNLSWVSKLDKFGYTVSTGSACSTARDQPSTLSGAIGLSNQESRRLLRVSSYSDTPEVDWLGLAVAFKDASLELFSERENSGIIKL